MKKIRLTENELSIDVPLPWPVYAPDGELLLERGQHISSERQKYILLTRGLYREANVDEVKVLEKAKFSLSSPFNVLDAIRQNLTRILQDMNQLRVGDYNQRVIKVATVIQKLCRQDADAALGAMVLDQEPDYVGIHPVMCAILLELLLSRKNVPAQDRLLYIAAALTQNIGMLELQQKLSKQQSPLTAKQQRKISEHPFKSREILQGLGIDHKEWLDTVQHHHERPDGGGYPKGLSGEQISVYARVLSLADIYSAMILPREYRDGYFIKRALRDIFMQRGSAVDPNLAQLLIKELGIYPPGCFVKLANGDTAIVVRRDTELANAPLVLSVLSPGGVLYKPPERRNCKEKRYGIVKVIPRVEGLVLDKNQIWGLDKKQEP